MALTDKLTAIANAIRNKTGTTDKLTLDQMVVEINKLTLASGDGGSSGSSGGSTGGGSSGSGGATKYTQSQQFDAVISQCKSDLSSYDANTTSITQALSGKKGNCVSFASYVRIACDYLGVTCDIIAACNESGLNSLDMSNMHMFNRVMLDGTTYFSDISSGVAASGYNFDKTTSSGAYSANRFEYYYIMNNDGSYSPINLFNKTTSSSTSSTASTLITQAWNNINNTSAKTTIQNKFTAYKN